MIPLRDSTENPTLILPMVYACFNCFFKLYPTFGFNQQFLLESVSIAIDLELCIRIRISMGAFRCRLPPLNGRYLR
ncbi:MAG: hypothetical protein EA409_11965 [Saprospirales bacterium]|nr:MAG: hypothetical protein EA409_11965 [Saprospirales bacterium]